MQKGQTFQRGSDVKPRECSWRPHTGADYFGQRLKLPWAVWADTGSFLLVDGPLSMLGVKLS